MSSDITRTFERGNLHELAEFLVTPARSGIFLTRSRIRSLAGEMGLRAGRPEPRQDAGESVSRGGFGRPGAGVARAHRRGGGGEPRPLPRLVGVPALKSSVARVDEEDAGSQASPRTGPKMGARHARGSLIGLLNNSNAGGFNPTGAAAGFAESSNPHPE